MSGLLTRIALRTLDAITPAPTGAAHLATGARGEEEAYFFLRQNGYVMVARNWRTARRRGELDLVGWEGDVLCFVEVKTRSGPQLVPAEVAVDGEKQDELRGMAREFLRRVPDRPAIRFDVISIYTEASGGPPQISLFRNAFTMS
jgi:putative endonuclease